MIEIILKEMKSYRKNNSAKTVRITASNCYKGPLNELCEHVRANFNKEQSSTQLWFYICTLYRFHLFMIWLLAEMP